MFEPVPNDVRPVPSKETTLESDQVFATLSIAISAKRIADTLDKLTDVLRDIRDN